MAVVAAATEGGTALTRGSTILQLRIPGAPARRLELEARALIATAHVPVLVNSRVDVALAVGAYGVHLPEADIETADARRLLGPDRLLGRSVHSLQGAVEATGGGADYVVFGPVFETVSHPGRRALGLQALRDVCSAVPVPVLAIGGVGGDRVRQVQEAGARGYAAIAAFRP